jgi:hypothetical protein
VIPRLPRVLDASAIVDLFRGHEQLTRVLFRGDQGEVNLLLATTAIADAETRLGAGASGWELILRIPCVQSLNLTEHAAIEIGSWPGQLSSRHVVHEALALRAVVLTTEPGAYKGLRVPLMVL